MDTKTQQRAICPACFAEQAIKGGKLVAHGYTRPQHWHSNVGTCAGARHAHFGTEAGRKYTADMAQRLNAAAVDGEANAARVLAGSDPVLMRERIKGSRVYQLVRVENPTVWQRKEYAASLTRQAEAMRAQAVELATHVRDWKPVEPITVEVEPKQTLLHWRGGYYGGKACASSAMGARKGYTTSDITKVTCAKCCERHDYWKAKKGVR